MEWPWIRRWRWESLLNMWKLAEDDNRYFDAKCHALERENAWLKSDLRRIAHAEDHELASDPQMPKRVARDTLGALYSEAEMQTRLDGEDTG